jgi:hypothetical protein
VPSSTNELVKHLRGLGLHSSVELVRQDVLRGLIAPHMPTVERPGRGHASMWSAMAVRRARYLARLRRRGIDGRVLPLLAYIWDGWGWETIAPAVARAMRRSAAIDRRSLRPHLIRDRADIEDRAAQGPSEAEPPHTGTTLEARKYILSALLTGAPMDGTSPRGFAEDLLKQVARLLGENPSADEIVAGSAFGEQVAHARRAWGQTPTGVADWLLRIDPETAARGRTRLLAEARLIRRIIRASGERGSSNVLSWCGTGPTELRQQLRATTGRPTPALMIGSWLAQEIFAAELERRATQAEGA